MKSRNKFLLVNGWSDDNKGDSAILVGLINIIKEEDKDFKINIVSELEDVERNYRHINKKFSDVGVVNNYKFIYGDNKVSKLFSFLYQFIKSLAILFWINKIGHIPKLLITKREILLMKKYKESDFVISKGGHVYFSQTGLKSFLGFYRRAFPILIGIAMEKKNIIYAQSIGPIHGYLSKKFSRILLKKCDVVVLREKESEDYIREKIFTKVDDQEENLNLMVSWDTAFATNKEDIPPEVQLKLPSSYITLTTRQWKFPYKKENTNFYDRYITEIANLIIGFSKDYKMPIVLAPQVIGPTETENDYVSWDHVFTKIKDIDGNFDITKFLKPIRADLTPGELVSLYSKAELTIGTRFHSVILSLVGGTPAIAISYHGFKSTGIMKMLGYTDYCTSIDKVESEDLLAMSKSIFEENGKISKRVSFKISKIKKTMESDFKVISNL